jgi:hypothetical protein
VTHGYIDWGHEHPSTGEYRLRAERAERRLRIAEQALRDIIRCDYRGNEPSEQMIARLALADIERARR